MSDTPVPGFADEKPRWSRRKKLLLTFEVLVLLSIPAAVIGAYFFYVHRVDQALAEAIAESDLLDPDWRLENIEKRRMAIPAEQNAAGPIQAAMVIMPPMDWLSDPEMGDLLDLPPQCRLDAQLTDKLRKALASSSPAAAEVKKAIPLRNGSFALTCGTDLQHRCSTHTEGA